MELKEGEVYCDECNGSGNRAKWDQIPDYKCYLPCNKCHGKGKLDWIENVVGKKRDKIKINMIYGQYRMKNPNPNMIIGGCVS